MIPVPGRGMWAWGARPSVMGILNITPDSFSDGGAHCDVRLQIYASHRWRYLQMNLIGAPSVIGSRMVMANTPV